MGHPVHNFPAIYFTGVGGGVKAPVRDWTYQALSLAFGIEMMVGDRPNWSLTNINHRSVAIKIKSEINRFCRLEYNRQLQTINTPSMLILSATMGTS